MAPHYGPVPPGMVPNYGPIAPVQYGVAPAAGPMAPTPMMAVPGGTTPGTPGVAYQGAPMTVYDGTPMNGQPVVTGIQTMPSTIEPVPSGAEGWQGGACTDGEGCNSCDACDDCGQPGCACDCGDGLFGSGCCAWLFHRNHLHDGLHSHLQKYFDYPRAVRVWGGVEGLWWWNKERSLPVLATTSVPGTPYPQAGVLGEPGTSVLFGGGEFDGDGSEGVRGTLGFWLDSNQNIGIFTRVFQYGAEEIGYRASSTGDPILARPYYDIGLGAEDALVVAYPGISRGNLDINTTNEARGFDVLLRKLLYYGECNRFDVICGYHNTELIDRVRIGHEIISIDPEGRVPVGTRINTVDSFRAENEFNGGSIGMMATGFDGRLTWNLLTKVSFGNNRERVSINGTSTTSIPGGGSATFDQGLLALDTNSGVYEDDRFAIVPELDLSVMYNLCSMLSVSVGYSVIYWTDVALAGDAIDTVINPTQIDGPIIGPARPTYSLVDDDFWLHGLTFGIHGRF